MNWTNYLMKLVPVLSSIEPRVGIIMSSLTRLWSFMKLKMKKKNKEIIGYDDTILLDQTKTKPNRTRAIPGPPMYKEANMPMFGQKLDQLEEVDPNGIDQHYDGAKLDSGKPDASLLGMFGSALLAVAQVGTLGALKYTRGGWRNVDDGINRYTAAMLRHYLKENESPFDDDLPVLHAAQVAWNALARLELMIEDGKNAMEAEERGG